MAEAWYKHVSFDSDVFAAIDLTDYLSQDRWGFNLQPFKIVRQVALTLKDNHVPTKSVTSNLLVLRCLQRRVLLHITIIADELQDRF